MSENAGNVVGLLRSSTEPPKSYVIWARTPNLSLPTSVDAYFININGSWQGIGYGGVTSSTMTMADGNQSVTAQPGMAWQSYQRVRIASSGTKLVEGNVVSYDAETGAMVVDVDTIIGSGTLAIGATVNAAGISSGGSYTAGTGIVISGSEISLDTTYYANNSQAGLLSAADHISFSAKQNALSFGNVSETTSSILAFGGNTGAVIGSGLSITVQKADGTHPGYLAAADFVTFNGKQAALGFTPENSANKGANSGYASLDSGGKIPTSQLPSAVLGAVDYSGTWNVTANTVSAGTAPVTGNASTQGKGVYYKVSVAGTRTIDGISIWNVGDWCVSNGTTWDKIDNYEAVASVNGAIGTVSLTVSNTGSSLAYDVSTPTQLNIPTATNSITGLLGTSDYVYFTAKQDASAKNANNGYAGLDSSGNVLVGHLPYTGSGGDGIITAAKYTQFNSWGTNPTTTAGDIIYRSSGGTLVTRAIGGNGTILSIVSGLPQWTSTISAATNFSGEVDFAGGTTITSSGYLVMGTAANATFAGNTLIDTLGNYVQGSGTSATFNGTTIETAGTLNMGINSANFAGGTTIDGAGNLGFTGAQANFSNTTSIDSSGALSITGGIATIASGTGNIYTGGNIGAVGYLNTDNGAISSSGAGYLTITGLTNNGSLTSSGSFSSDSGMFLSDGAGNITVLGTSQLSGTVTFGGGTIINSSGSFIGNGSISTTGSFSSDAALISSDGSGNLAANSFITTGSTTGPPSSSATGVWVLNSFFGIDNTFVLCTPTAWEQKKVGGNNYVSPLY